MFERFTDRARQVVVFAQDEARGLGHNWIGTEHLLLGVLREEGDACEALTAAGLSLDSARDAVVVLVGVREGVTSGQIPFLPQAKRALETSLKEATRLRKSVITPELVLVGVLMQRSGTSACVLRDCGVDTTNILVALGLEGDIESGSVQPDADAAPELAGGEPSHRAQVPRVGRSLEAEESIFYRFTERAREVVVLAQDEARGLKHDYIGTEHILLGLLREEDGLAARVLATFEINVDQVRGQVVQVVGEGDEVTSGKIPFTPRAKKVLELALREALSLGHNYIGTEHILLGLVRDNEGIAARILLDFNADAERIRNEIIRMLSGPGRRGSSTTSAGSSPRAIDETTLALTVGGLLDSVRVAKESAIQKREFERAAEIRVLERQLKKLLSAVTDVIGPG